MKKTEIQQKIVLEQLEKQHTLTVPEVIKLLNVSESTARRLFKRLDEQGVALRRFGGIQLLKDSTTDYRYEQVINQSAIQKLNIGKYAAGLVESGDVIYIDSGTTTACFCSELATVLNKGKINSITVFTNSLVNLEVLSPQTQVNIVGGEYRLARRDFCGYLTEEAIDKLHFTKCFLGTDGFHQHYGFTATDFATAKLNRLVINNTDKSFVLMDSNKFMNASVVSYSKEKPVDYLITDCVPSEELRENLTEIGTELILCN